jgi:ketosteroid isomerase-like protein
LFTPVSTKAVVLKFSRLLTIVFGTLAASAPLSRSAGAQVLPGVGMETQTAQGEVGAYRARVQSELTTILNRWGELTEQKDSSALVSLYTPNARAVATGSGDAWGARGVVSQMWNLSLAGAHLYVVIDDFDMSGDMAYVSSVVTVSPTDASGPLTGGIAHAFFVFVSDSRGRWHIRGQSLSLPRAGTS